MGPSITHGCGVVLGTGEFETYRTEERTIYWEGSHSNPSGGGSATVYEYEGICPACGGELDPERHRAKEVDD